MIVQSIFNIPGDILPAQTTTTSWWFECPWTLCLSMGIVIPRIGWHIHTVCFILWNRSNTMGGWTPVNHNFLGAHQKKKSIAPCRRPWTWRCARYLPGKTAFSEHHRETYGDILPINMAVPWSTWCFENYGILGFRILRQRYLTAISTIGVTVRKWSLVCMNIPNMCGFVARHQTYDFGQPTGFFQSIQFRILVDTLQCSFPDGEHLVVHPTNRLGGL